MGSVNMSVWHIIGSMRSVDKWSQAAQSNIGNATKIGYKQYEVNFNGGFATTIKNNPTMQRAGTQIAEQLIGLAYTSIDWRQGEIIKTKLDTDFAINGQGFFMLTEGVPASGSKIYFTRDGQFHEDSSGRLLNSNGLFYVTRADAVAMSLMTGGTNQHAIGLPASLGSLRYSKFGSTIFESTSFDPTSPTNGVIVDEPEKSGLGLVVQNSLESSNVNMEKQLISLNDSKSAYTVLSKQLTVYWQNFDIGLNLLK